jgi:protein-tyrosine phosphatase
MEENPEKKITIGWIEDLDYPNSHPYKDSIAVINCLHGKGEEVTRDGKPCLDMQLYDDGHISNYAFDTAIEFIDKYANNGKVLVCCEAGTSRSVAVGIAYYMSKGKKFEDATKLLDKGAPRMLHFISVLNWAENRGYISSSQRKELTNKYYPKLPK